MKKEAMLYKKRDNKWVDCFLCAHRCRIAPSKFGVCGVRQNIGGILYTYAYGEAVAAHVDPIEKKPLYHFLPGTSSYSIATIGCNFKCSFCQNWQISQASFKDGGMGGQEMSPDEVVREAIRNGCKSVSYTYTEPTIFFEYALDASKAAKKENLGNVFVTNGYMTREALDVIEPYLDAANIDLKSFSDAFYAKVCKGKLQPVLDTIKAMKELGIWVEITTLVIPGLNDSEEELGKIAEFISGVDKGIPWHVSAFHPDYQLTDLQQTPLKTLKLAKETGESFGLRYVYLGNVLEGTDTYCYACRGHLIRRVYYNVEILNMKKDTCSLCGAKIDGVWDQPQL